MMPHEQNPGQVAQVAEKLIALGFTIVTARFGDAPCITVLATQATRQLTSCYKGQGFDGRGHYRTYGTVIDGVQVEWHRPQVAPAMKPSRWQSRRPWRTLSRKALH